jgi:hypothetical protein
MKRKSGRQLIRQGRATLIQQKHTIITVVLLTALVLLLFGIFSRCRRPSRHCRSPVQRPLTTARSWCRLGRGMSWWSACTIKRSWECWHDRSPEAGP